jgi:hypothetical protein
MRGKYTSISLSFLYPATPLHSIHHCESLFECRRDSLRRGGGRPLSTLCVVLPSTTVSGNYSLSFMANALMDYYYQDFP